MKCNYDCFVLKIRCPFYFVGECTLKKLKADDKACFFKEKNKILEEKANEQ